MKNKLTSYLFLMILVVGIFVFDVKRSWNVFLRNDYRLAIIAEDGMSLVSISPNRGMVNVLKIDVDTYVWIPTGYGWYRSDKVFKLLTQENKKDLIDDILFYNFGFEADSLFWLDSLADWEKWSNMSTRLGIIPSMFVKWRFNNMFFREEDLVGDLVANLKLDEMLRREFADSALVEEGVRLSVYNDSGQNKAASWMADRLNWTGLAVLAVGDWRGEKVDNCAVFFNKNLEKSLTVDFLKKKLIGCDFGIGEDVIDGEVEIVLGSGWAKMVNYKSYVRTF